MAMKRKPFIKKGQMYGKLIIELPLVATQDMDEDYAYHVEEEFVQHSAETIIRYAVNGPPSDMEGMTFDIRKTHFKVE